MDDPSITINDEEGLTSLTLQIDCDLAAPTSITSASSTLTTPFTTPFTTPKGDHTGNGGGSSNNNNEPSSEWIAFYERLNRTPPKAARTAQFHDTLATANALLELSEESGFHDKSFDDLTHDQKAILMLMIMKGMDMMFDGGRQASAKVLIKALHPESMEYKRMTSFVRQDGDCQCPIQTLLQQKVSRYVAKFTAQNATTIFKKRPNMLPFLHLQREDSYICAYNACSALLYYCSHNSKVENDDESISTIKMNISRYVRDEVSGLEIANFALTTVKGAYLERVLLGLTKSFGTTDCRKVENIPTWEGNEDQNFFQIQAYLSNGRPFVFGIECFPGLDDKRRSKYIGKVADFYDDNLNKRPKDSSDRIYHTLLCTGITPRNGRLVPPMLLVQDSCSSRPVFEIGLDLLMDLGLENSTPCTVPRDWTFNKNMDYTVNPEAKALFCGSPMSLDDKGVPRIINTEKPIQVQREDMSRYLDVVTVKPDDRALVFMT
jgi:hypothetical protein